MSFSTRAHTKQPAYRHVKDALNNVYFPRGRATLRDFRVSSRPYCPILDLLNYFEARKSGPQTAVYRQQFYFSVGHTVHDLWQAAMVASPKYGYRVWGNWVCPRCQKQLKHQHRPKQSCCGLPWVYEEVSYRYRGLNGHSDMLTQIDKHNYAIWELKTVPDWFLRTERPCSTYQMYPKSLLQGRTYAALARKMLGLPVTQIVIVNLGRERPDLEHIKLNAVPFTDKDYRRVMRQLDRDVAARKAVTRLLQHKKQARPPKDLLQAMLDERPCRTREDYYRKMDMRWFGKSRCPVYQTDKICLKDSNRPLRSFIREVWATQQT